MEKKFGTLNIGNLRLSVAVSKHPFNVLTVSLHTF